LDVEAWREKAPLNGHLLDRKLLHQFGLDFTGLKAQQGLGKGEACRVHHHGFVHPLASADLNLRRGSQAPSQGQQQPAQSSGGEQEENKPPQLDQSLLPALLAQPSTPLNSRR
jgi:hypothetical protein